MFVNDLYHPNIDDNANFVNGNNDNNNNNIKYFNCVLYMSNQFITAFSEHHKFNSGLYNLEFPATVLVYGEPKSGKTYFVLNLLKDIKHNFDEKWSLKVLLTSILIKSITFI